MCLMYSCACVVKVLAHQDQQMFRVLTQFSPHYEIEQLSFATCSNVSCNLLICSSICANFTEPGMAGLPSLTRFSLRPLVCLQASRISPVISSEDKNLSLLSGATAQHHHQHPGAVAVAAYAQQWWYMYTEIYGDEDEDDDELVQHH